MTAAKCVGREAVDADDPLLTGRKPGEPVNRHDRLAQLFKRRSHCGLYMRAPRGHRVLGVNAISMTPVTAINEKRYVGVGVRIIGLEFAVIFDPRGASPDQLALEGWRLRPTDMSFRTKKRTHWLILTWPAGVPSSVIEMTMTR